MTEKVKITQEQADAINWILSAQSIDELIVAHARNNGGYVRRAKALKGMSAIKLTKALRVGYEIEPKYKVGDWVANLDGSDFYPIGNVKVVEVLKVKESYGAFYARHGEDGRWESPFSNLRHAIPEEIKAEKERLLWKSIGREVGEFKETDSGFDYDGIFVPGITALTQVYSRGDLQGFYPAESYINLVDGEADD